MTAPIVLCDASYYGTLAATRAFGRAGIPVIVVTSAALHPAAWSRYAAETVRVSADGPRGLLECLQQIGRRAPGAALYSTSDETAFLFSKHQRELGAFRMHQPSLDTMITLLDKRRLHAAATAVGLETPETWAPRSEAELAEIQHTLPSPVVLKPATQIFSRFHQKGVLVKDPTKLVDAYARFHANNQYAAELLEHIPDARLPLVQRYYGGASSSVYSIAGFVDRDGRLRSASASRKILQRPRDIGIGLCFVEAELDHELAHRLTDLAKQVGFFGTFEAEFLEVDGSSLLIDFNPRFYNQMGFDVARGFPLPLMVHAAATGDDARLDELTREAAMATHDRGLVFVNRFGFEMTVGLQSASGAMATSEARRWRRWYSDRRSRAVDAASDRGDVLPGIVDVASHVASYLRHPRAFVRSMVLNLSP